MDYLTTELLPKSEKVFTRNLGARYSGYEAWRFRVAMLGLHGFPFLSYVPRSYHGLGDPILPSISKRLKRTYSGAAGLAFRFWRRLT